MTKDVGAGPYCLPYRWRPLTWSPVEKDESEKPKEGEKKKDEVKYFNERAISTQQTGFSFVSQSRSYLPDPVGGVLWFGVDDTYSTVYVPMYCGIREVPKSFAVGTGSFHDFTWDSAFWVFNFVSNYAYSRYCDMIVDIQKVQSEFEGKFFAQQAEVEKAAKSLFEKSPELARDYLTAYSVKHGDEVVKRWKKLGEFLIYKYLDGNVKDEKGKVTHPGYPKIWYKKVVEQKGEHFKVKPVEDKEAGSH
jgi:dipeptidase